MGERCSKAPGEGKGRRMTNEVRERGGNEINFSSSEAGSQPREGAAVQPRCKTQQRNGGATDEGKQTQTVFQNSDLKKKKKQLVLTCLFSFSCR